MILKPSFSGFKAESSQKHMLGVLVLKYLLKHHPKNVQCRDGWECDSGVLEVSYFSVPKLV